MTGVRLLVCAVALCVLTIARPVSAAGSLQASISADDPAKPAITLTNTSDKACQVIDTAQGTVAITSVAQHGKTISATAIDTAADEDVGYLLKSHFKTLRPGGKLAVPLESYKLAFGQVLRATTWSPDGGTYVTQYNVAQHVPLQLALSYTIPLSPEVGAPVCATAIFASNIIGTTTVWRVVGYGILVAVVLALAVLTVYFWRRRRGRKQDGDSNKGKKFTIPKAVAIVGLLLGIGVWFHQLPTAAADVSVPSDLQSAYSSCMTTLESNRDITGPVLDALNAAGVHVEIVRTHGGSETTGYRSGSSENFTIYWNPDDTHRYAGTGGNADPCTSLYHEMYHVLDMHNGTFSRDECAGSGIETKEVMATRAQNVLRLRLGMPARSHYGDRPLPSGDCTAPPDSRRCTGEHCGDTNGDPHLLTFDGLRYDFQAAGEFVAARDTSGTFEAQVRQQPWSNSRTVSINTAVALRVGKDRVEIRAGTALGLLVNGKPAAVASAQLPGGGSITVDQEQAVIVVTWPDQSLAYVRSVGTYGISISLQPSDTLAGSLEGLFGNADDNSANDLHLQGSKDAIKPDFDKLYPKFADSWRITDKTSLFTYTKGKSTASYTDKSMPEKPSKATSLPGYAAAEYYCKRLGLTDPTIIANCALDLAVTGQPVFAKAALHSQRFATGSGANAGTSWQLGTVQNGTPVNETFSGAAGEKVFVSVPKTSLPSQCGTLQLLGPDDHEVSNGCIINGNGYIDGTVLPVTGNYTIRLTPQGSGTATITLLRIQDKSGTVTIDGPSVTTTIDQPGVVARYTFTGTAGQRVYTNIPSSTLSSQCGIVRLFGPDDHEVSNGCIINKRGNIDTTVLPANGRYTLVLDPNDFTTGKATFRLTSATAQTQAIGMNGPTLSINLAKPGSIATVTFNASAGQKIYVDLPSSELPSQCGILTLRAPDGTSLASGCVINGKGNLTDDAVTLPASGQYTLTLDPNDDATGATTIRLYT